MTEVNRS